MLERRFQSDLIKEIRRRLPECMIIKQDPSYIQGLPDLLILNGNKWAALECKSRKGAHHQPNQDYYIERLGEMSFARFIYPENKEEILNELQQALEC